MRGVLPGSAELVRVDEMGPGEAEQLLAADVVGVSSGVVAGLLAVTGRWPVLIALVNGAVRADQNAGRRAEDSMREILQELRTTGPTALCRILEGHRRLVGVCDPAVLPTPS